MIRLADIKKIYRTTEVETSALNGVSLTIQQGEFVSIMGPSGCGKSTLLNILGLIDSPSEGEYYFGDLEVAKYSESKRADIRKGNIGFIFQRFNLIDEHNVFDNVELALIYTDMKSKNRKERVMAVLEKMNMTHRMKHYPQQLSGGQQQRVAIARAIVNRPKLILADEPTGNLDTKNGEDVMQLLTQLNEEGTTIIMVTHSPHDAEYGQRIINVLDGKIVSENKLKAFQNASPS
ncbi:MAG: ABC transporter ATP-binding protein [Thermonemataceae bacterium]